MTNTHVGVDAAKICGLLCEHPPRSVEYHRRKRSVWGA